ncbi:MAG TPA: fatty acid desaturase [Solirubrobacteraceae bacterium]|jgi:omega-6 fatty acid desaturase (delta-12 desaturase)|nr:fatty acid desaturase [Solirubrobacteraceae bacterium]
MVLTETAAPGAIDDDARPEPGAPTAGDESAAARGAYWNEVLAPYAKPSLRLSIGGLFTSVLPYFGLLVAMYFALRVSVLLELAISVLAAGFLLRTYIVFHDCSHGSYLPSKRANIWLGSVLGVIVYAPFANWRHNHAVHHATAADLDRRGQGDVPTLTISEYHSKGWRGRTGYRLFRNPVVMFGLGPLFAMILGPRIVPKDARPRIRRSVHLTNVALAIIVGVACWLLGWRDFLLIQGPPALIAGAAGIWLFYVQHQFEDTFWERGSDWTYADAALRGSSYLKLPAVLQYFTGNIGLHHVHHLCARIPNYNLQAAHDENPIFHDVPTLSLWDGLRAVQLKLWDEDARRLVGWSAARAAWDAQRRQAAASPS